MSASPQSWKRRALWLILSAFIMLAALAVNDWRKPPAAQTSVRLFTRAIFEGYHRFVRPTTARFVRCRFQPTCSVYALIAVQTYGFPKGAWLTGKRLLRCQPSVPLGTPDPVPAKPAPPQLASTR